MKSSFARAFHFEDFASSMKVAILFVAVLFVLFCFLETVCSGFRGIVGAFICTIGLQPERPPFNIHFKCVGWFTESPVTEHVLSQ